LDPFGGLGLPEESQEVEVLTKVMPTEEIIGLLGAGPRRIAELTDGLPAGRLASSPSEGEWSANEVLAHLRAYADVAGTSIERLIREEDPTICAVNPRELVHEAGYLKERFGPSLAAYEGQRTQLLAISSGSHPRTG
jgi:hypothetical protein